MVDATIHNSQSAINNPQRHESAIRHPPSAMSPSLTLRQARDAVRTGARSAVDVCRDALARIEAGNPRLNAFNTIAADRALARAAAIDREPGRWREAPLAGVPIAIKDNICTRGLRTTASSRMLEQYVPPYDATVAARLEAAGAVIVGKTNCDEFAMGSSNETSAFGPVRNPWDLDRSPGGTSGGSAAAVAARLTPAALGSDTGGSIRQPASLCGVVGLKPTYGRVSRFGLIAHGSSLDQIGPLATTAHDAAVLLGVLAGADPCDSTSAPEPVPDYPAALTGDIRGARIGVPRALFEQGVDPQVAAAIDAALDSLRGRGAALVDIDLPHARYATPVYYLVSTAEASSNLARYDGVRYGFRASLDPGLPAGAARPAADSRLQQMYARTRAQGFGPEVKRRIMLGTYVLSAGYYDAYYLKAQQVRTLIRRDYDRAFERVDVVAMPTSPVPAFRLGEKVADPLQMYLVDVFTVSANLTGLPAISVPCGFTAARLPIGLQLTGRRFDEATLLRVADAYERDTAWSTQLPPIPSR
jgi:aspartyl-tRNA(Asn)/glutamyl-tRNA(Gln) amidotransferase subunit A